MRKRKSFAKKAFKKISKGKRVKRHTKTINKYGVSRGGIRL